MERWDKPYRLRLFSPIEGELCPSDRMMEENISLTAYEMELYEEPIRDSLKQAELLVENNQIERFSWKIKPMHNGFIRWRNMGLVCREGTDFLLDRQWEMEVFLL